MNIKATLFILVIAIILGVWFAFFEADNVNQPKPNNTTQNTEAGELLFPNFNAMDYTKVTITTLADGSMTAERDIKSNSDWNQTAPIQFPLQAYRIDSILTQTKKLRFVQSIAADHPKITLEKMGLTKPTATLILEGKGVETITLRLGQSNLGGRAYVAKTATGPAEAFVVRNELHHAILKDPLKSMRQNSLVKDLTAGNAVSITITQNGKITKLIKTDGQWDLVDQAPGRADKAAAEALVSALSSAWVDEFISDNPDSLQPFGLDKPYTQITITTLAASTLTKPKDKNSTTSAPPTPPVNTYKLTIGSSADLNGDKFFAIFNDVPVVFTLGKSSKEKFDLAPHALRDPRLTPKLKTDFTEVTLSRSDDFKLHLIKEEGVWKFGENAPKFKLEPAQAEALLSLITDTKADDFSPLPKTQGQPIATLTLAVVASTEDEILKVYPYDDQNYLVLRNAESVGGIVSKVKLELLTDSILAYRNLNVFDITESDIKALTITRTGKHPATYRFARTLITDIAKDINAPLAQGRWKLDGFDVQRFMNLIQQLTPLRTVEWLGDSLQGGDNIVTLSLTTTDNKTHNLTIDTDAAIGQTAGNPQSFKLNPQAVAALMQEFKDRIILKIDPANIASITIGPLAIKRDSEGKYRIPNKKVNEATAASMYDTLAGLQAEHYIPSPTPPTPPTHTLFILTRDTPPITHTLKLWKKEGAPSIGQLGNKTFTLTSAAIEALTKDPLELTPAPSPTARPQGLPQGLPPGLLEGLGLPKQ